MTARLITVTNLETGKATSHEGQLICDYERAGRPWCDLRWTVVLAGDPADVTPASLVADLRCAAADRSSWRYVADVGDLCDFHNASSGEAH